MLVMLLGGCITANQGITKKQHYNLQDQDYRQTFLMNMNTCFISYNTCRVRKQSSPRQCWTAHEKCVINTNKQYNKIKEEAKKRRAK
jgi:hypothetical protein